MGTSSGASNAPGSCVYLTSSSPASNAVYGLGLIGAWVYYFSQAKSLLDGVLAFFQGLVWPAFVIYDLLQYLNPS